MVIMIHLINDINGFGNLYNLENFGEVQIQNIKDFN